MKKRFRLLQILALSLFVGGMVISLSPGAESGGNDGGDGSWSAYSIIVERNMFSRQRGPRQREDREDRRVREAPPAPNPESYYVLRGIVQEDGNFTAFIEDTRRDDVLRLQPGQAVARGSVKSLDLDTLEYELGGQTVVVRIGQDLEGGQGAVTMADLLEVVEASPSTPAATQQEGSESTAPAAGDDADILRQMMQRRQQQLGQ